VCQKLLDLVKALIRAQICTGPAFLGHPVEQCQAAAEFPTKLTDLGSELLSSTLTIAIYY